MTSMTKPVRHAMLHVILKIEGERALWNWHLLLAHGDSKEVASRQQASKPTLYCRIALRIELLSVLNMNSGILEKTAAAISIVYAWYVIMCIYIYKYMYVYIVIARIVMCVGAIGVPCTFE